MDLTEVIIDRKLLETFRRHAMRALPNEHAELLIGSETAPGVVAVTGLLPVTVTRTSPDDIEFEYEDVVPGLVGWMHSHPNGVGQPSDEDLAAPANGPGTFLGICAIRQGGKRRYTSFSFWRVAAQQVEMTVVEDDNESTNADSTQDSGPSDIVGS